MQNIKLFILWQEIYTMTKVKKKPVGRPELPESEKKKGVAAYLTAGETKKIIGKYGSLTEAIRVEILPKCTDK